MSLLIGDHITPAANDMAYWDGAKWVLEPHRNVTDAHNRNLFEQYRTGKYLVSPLCSKALGSTLVLTANRLYAMAFPISRDMTPATIWIHIQLNDAINPNLRLGLYNAGANMVPGTRLSNGGVVDVSAVGIKTVAYVTPLTGSMVWVCFVADGTPTIYTQQGYAQFVLGSSVSSSTV